ncbi:DUF3466 family protein [Vibrio scophthalmi]|uniref:Uncharacterized protein n=1 Tax=Vibrio scophthalmi TaxID=45658 RepID=A0A1B1NNY0_9VIBR|nr:DUF3466 family protein [Vibrio scophthalmi]ANS85442.1 hypothetical protein VSVS12_01675 [Vibrio scophthalmi]ANU36428.1 hypothetical protein VSVS05_01301 [Vibrio scophthalmi]
MRSNVFKISAIAATIAASFGAQAALYNVVEINESATDAYGLGGYKTEYHGTSVESVTVPGGNPLGCFDNTYSCPDSKISAETRNWPAGLSYREEVPFAMDNGFDYSIYDRDDFENYCDGQLGYATCDTWANKQSEGYEKERTDSLYTNSIAFIEGQDAVSAENAVINSISSDGLPVGNKRVGTVRNQAFSSVALTGLGTTPAIVATHAWKTDGTYTVGSVSREKGNDEGTWFYSKAVIWNNSLATELNFANGGHDISDNRLSQASIRDFTIDNGMFYGVGYNTYGDQRMDATIYSVDVANIADADKITSTPVSGATSGSDYIFTNSVVSSINQNKVAVGSAKLSKGNPLDGAAANRLFFVEDVTVPTATYFAGALFANKGGTIGAINNFNEVVGSVDITSGREIDGTPRVQRGFINPYIAGLTGNNELRADVFKKQAWLLDDLTNGIDENNEFRVINASDINDAGVISATALKCDGGYDTTDIDSYCKNGEFGVEKVVAVKLIPIAEESARDIQARGFRTTKVERSGASLGWLALGLLTLLGFRRK